VRNKSHVTLSTNTGSSENKSFFGIKTV